VSWSDPVYAAIAEHVRVRTGLVFPSARREGVEEAIRKEMAALGIADPRRYLQRLDHESDTRDALVARLTVGESYFFRDDGQFGVLRERVLPELAAAGHAQIRCWSAGCSAGEEPYSLAIMMEELRVQEHFILGTDIARPRLLQAQRGEYSRWSLRGVPDETVDRYFRRERTRFVLKERIRDHVQLGYLNLAEDHYPSLGSGAWGMHLILCRNVLIYFDRDTVAAVAARLLETLTPDGWLILGAADPVVSELVRCEPVLTAAGLAYRRSASASASVPAATGPAAAAPHPPGHETGRAPVTPVAAPARPRRPPRAARPAARPAPAWPRAAAPSDRPDPAVPPVPAPAGEDAVRAYLERRYGEAAAAAERTSLDGPMPATLWITWVRALANAGRLDDAGRINARALEALGPTAELLYLEAVLLLQAGRHADAAAAARRALYLDRGLVMAYLTLADAHARLHRTDAARRALRNAAELLGSTDPAEPVPAGDGETAGRLAELVRVRQRLLDEAA
jgi:chemotaxis protein methyltransferase CheR